MTTAVGAPTRSRARLSRLDAYLLAQLARPLFTALGLTLVALMLEKALRLVHELSAAGGRLSFVGPVMAGLLPYYFGTALPLSFFVALFVVVTTLDANGEVEAMMAAGVSLDRIAAPFVAVGVVLTLVGLLVAAGPEPLGRYASKAAEAAARSAGWAARVEAGAVASPRPGLAFEADHALGGRLRGVFLARTEADGSETIATARAGGLSLTASRREVRIALQDGLILRTRAGDLAPQTRFESLVQVEPSGEAATLGARGGDVRELTLPELVGGLLRPRPRNPAPIVAAEVASTLAQAGATPLLPLLALPLGLAAKRGGRAPGIIAAGALLAVFHHVLELLRASADVSRPPAHGLILAAALGFAALVLAVYAASRRRPGDNPVSRAAEALAPLGVWFAATWARLPRPRLRAIGRPGLTGYVAQLLAVRTAAAGAALLAFLQVVDLQETAPTLLSRGLGVAGLIRYEALRLPGMIVQVAAFSLLIGAVFTFASLARRQESVAMQAAGLSPYRIVLAALPVALGVTGLLLVASAELAPRARASLDAWWTATAPKADAKPSPARWLRVGPDVLRLDAPARDGRALGPLALYRRTPQGLLLARTTARDGRWTGAGWTLQDAETLAVAPVTPILTRAAALPWPTRLRPADVARLQLRAEETPSLSAAWTRLAGRPSDKRAGALATRLHRLFSEPLAPLVMLLLASPILVGAGVRRSRTPQFAFALGGGLLFLVSDGFLTALGEAGDLAPVLAAWSAPAVFAAAGATALLFAEG